MIRYSSGTFVRHAGGKSLLWRPRTGACVVAEGAEPFLKPLSQTARDEREVFAEIAELGRKAFRSLPFAELAWLILHARLVVGNDSGPMHFAAAFDVPTLQFFSNSGADNWFCYDVARHGILMPDCGNRTGLRCGDCQRACIGEVPVSAAVREAKRLMSADNGA